MITPPVTSTLDVLNLLRERPDGMTPEEVARIIAGSDDPDMIKFARKKATVLLNRLSKCGYAKCTWTALK